MRRLDTLGGQPLGWLDYPTAASRLSDIIGSTLVLGKADETLAAVMKKLAPALEKKIKSKTLKEKLRPKKRKNLKKELVTNGII